MTTQRRAGSGRGGTFGTPNRTLNEQPPSADQDANVAVSGGGMVDKSGAAGAKRTARETGPGADSHPRRDGAIHRLRQSVERLRHR